MNISYIIREDWEADYFRQALGNEYNIRFISELNELSLEEARQTEVLSLFIRSVIDSDALEKFPNLKLITVRGTGYDHIDTETCRQLGITVCNVPGYGEHPVVEFTMALMLALSRRVFEASKKVKEAGVFSQKGLRGFDLYGKNLGVIGTGQIGMNVIKTARCFGMNISAYDPFPKPEVAEAVGFTYHDFDTILATSDIITLHAPHNEHTHHLINHDNINKVKPGAYLINTARGGLIETQALVKALSEGVVAGAALDVLEEEGMIGDEVGLLEEEHPEAETLQTMLSNHYLIHHPRVLITPHNAFNTEEALRKILDTTADNITSFIKDQPQNIVC